MNDITKEAFLEGYLNTEAGIGEHFRKAIAGNLRNPHRQIKSVLGKRSTNKQYSEQRQAWIRRIKDKALAAKKKKNAEVTTDKPKEV